MSAPAAAAASASAEAQIITSRNADTKPSSIARCVPTRWAGSIGAVISAPANFGNSRSTVARAGAGSLSWSSAGLTRALKARTSTIPNTAIATRPATRATALLTPDATPACCVSTAVIAVVVNGATTIAIPNPATTTAGKNVVQYEPPTPGAA